MPQPFYNAVLTDDGATLLTKSLGGELQVEFTGLVVGCGVYSEQEKSVSELQKRVGLKSPKNRYVFSDVSVHDAHSVKLTALITNQDPVTKTVLVEEGYHINEIGIYAKEKGKADASEVLYSISVTSGDVGDYMPAYDGYSPAQITQDIFAVVGNSGDVSINSVGAALLKDGDASDTIVNFSDPENRENISSGERLSVLLGKIKRFFADLKTVAFTGSYTDLSDKPGAKDVGAVSNKGDTITGILEIENTAQPYVAVKRKNESGILRAGSLLVSSGNNLGIWDTTNNKWVLYSNQDGTNVRFLGKADDSDKADVATKAIQDKNGKVIVDTYLPKSGGIITGNLSISGRNRINMGNYSGSTAYIESGGTAHTINMVVGNPSNTSSVHAMRLSAREDYATLESYDDTKLDLGAGGTRRFRNIYAQTGSIITSDRQAKKEIVCIGDNPSNIQHGMTDDQLISLIMGIKPVTYKFKDNDSNRPHHGLIAQDFENLLKEIGILDHAALIKTPKIKEEKIETGEIDDNDNPVYMLRESVIEGEYDYGFRYEELITDVIRFVQIQQERMNELELRLQELERN